MSDKDSTDTSTNPVVEVVSNVPATPVQEKIAETDRLNLEIAKQRRATAVAEAKTALAQNENAELAYKNVVLQIYLKYGLTEADAISEGGDIVRGGALTQNPAKTS